MVIDVTVCTRCEKCDTWWNHIQKTICQANIIITEAFKEVYNHPAHVNHTICQKPFPEQSFYHSIDGYYGGYSHQRSNAYPFFILWFPIDIGLENNH